MTPTSFAPAKGIRVTSAWFTCTINGAQFTWNGDGKFLRAKHNRKYAAARRAVIKSGGC